MTHVVGEYWVRTLLALILVYVGQKLAFPELNQLLGLGITTAVIVLKFVLSVRKPKIAPSES